MSTIIRHYDTSCILNAQAYIVYHERGVSLCKQYFSKLNWSNSVSALVMDLTIAKGGPNRTWSILHRTYIQFIIVTPKRSSQSWLQIPYQGHHIDFSSRVVISFITRMMWHKSDNSVFIFYAPFLNWESVLRKTLPDIGTSRGRMMIRLGIFLGICLLNSLGRAGQAYGCRGHFKQVYRIYVESTEVEFLDNTQRLPCILCNIFHVKFSVNFIAMICCFTQFHKRNAILVNCPKNYIYFLYYPLKCYNKLVFLFPQE